MPTFSKVVFFTVFLQMFFFFCISPAFAAPSFLESSVKDPTGARPLGMGGAYVGNAQGAEATFFNPAGLGNVGFRYTRGNVDVNRILYDQNSYEFLTLGSFGYGNWVRRSLLGEEVKVVAASYGNLTQKGGWGVTYKTITQGSLEGTSMDFGWLQLVNTDLLFGALLQDVFKNMPSLASSLRVGFAYTPLGEETLYVVEGDIRNLRDPVGPDVRMHYGVEAPFFEGFVGRAGWGEGRYTLGGTVQFPFLAVDYAMALDLIRGQETLRTVGVRVGGF